MFVPEEEGNILEELLLDTMNVDGSILAEQDRSVEEAGMWEDIGGGGIVGEQSNLMLGESSEGVPRGDCRAMIKYGGGSKKSEYRTMALAELELGQSTEEVMIEAERGAGEKSKGVENQEGGMTTQGALLTEIDRVMLRVEEAMLELEDSEGNKRVRRSLETSATEVRTLVKSID